MSSETKILVNDGLTALIVETLIKQRQEEYYPGMGGPDQMDDKIRSCKERVVVLRKMREDFENEMSKPI